jgi:hypothetical protein
MSTSTCPSSITTQSACNANPNSVWNSSANSGAGECVCCATDGSSYINTSTYTCTACGSNAKCGDGNGYCNGTTGDSTIQCVQNTTTDKWSYQCPSNACTGVCGPGSCGIKEWFLFSKCSKDSTTGFYQCGFSITQWKSILVYIGIIILLLIIIVVIFKALSRKPVNTTMTTVHSSTYPPLGIDYSSNL